MHSYLKIISTTFTVEGGVCKKTITTNELRLSPHRRCHHHLVPQQQQERRQRYGCCVVQFTTGEIHHQQQQQFNSMSFHSSLSSATESSSCSSYHKNHERRRHRHRHKHHSSNRKSNMDDDISASAISRTASVDPVKQKVTAKDAKAFARMDQTTSSAGAGTNNKSSMMMIGDQDSFDSLHWDDSISTTTKNNTMSQSCMTKVSRSSSSKRHMNTDTSSATTHKNMSIPEDEEVVGIAIHMRKSLNHNDGDNDGDEKNDYNDRKGKASRVSWGSTSWPPVSKGTRRSKKKSSSSKKTSTTATTATTIAAKQMLIDNVASSNSLLCSKKSTTPSLKSSSVSDMSASISEMDHCYEDSPTQMVTMTSATIGNKVTIQTQTSLKSKKTKKYRSQKAKIPPFDKQGKFSSDDDSNQTPVRNNRHRNLLFDRKAASMSNMPSSTQNSAMYKSFANMTRQTRQNKMMGKEASMSLATGNHRLSLHSMFEWSAGSKCITHDDLPRGDFVTSTQRSKHSSRTNKLGASLSSLSVTSGTGTTATTTTAATTKSPQYALTPAWPNNKRLSNRHLHAQFYERTMGQEPLSQPAQYFSNAAPAVTAAQMLDIMEPCSIREVLTFQGFSNGFDEPSANQLNYSDILDNNSMSTDESSSQHGLPTIIGQRYIPPMRTPSDPYSAYRRNSNDSM